MCKTLSKILKLKLKFSYTLHFKCIEFALLMYQISKSIDQWNVHIYLHIGVTY